MTPLLKKEIRLLLPAWLAVLLLETGLPWIGHDHDTAISFAPALFSLGMVLLAVDSFGREFSLGTFSALMVQPLERRQIWRTKLSVLLIAAALIFAAYFASCFVRLHLALADDRSIWSVNPTLIQGDFHTAMLASGVILLVALTGGLWAALLLRQTAAAFWIALLSPVGLYVTMISAMSLINKNPSDLFAYSVIYGTAGLYVAFAFWLAHRLFFQAEDAGWTGGVISLSKWRYFAKANPSRVSQRQPRSLAALLKNEWQLHSLSLLGAGALLGLHLAVLFLRAMHVHSHRGSLAEVASDCFWMLWLVLPLAMGCTAVAEERKLGLTEEQFCLPVSRRRQFFVKLLFTLLVGVLLGGVLPVLLETAALGWGAPCAFFKDAVENGGWFGAGVVGVQLTIVALAVVLAGVGFVSSTLARNFLQALSIAIVLIVSFCLCFPLIEQLSGRGNWVEGQRIYLFGLVPTSWGLLTLMGLPALVVVFPWLVYRNFCHFQESGRLWRRTLACTLGVGLFACISSAAIYQRPWEFFKPAEPPHGAAQFTLANPPLVQLSSARDLRVQLPGGRVWCDSLGYDFWGKQPTVWNILWLTLAHPLPNSTGPQALIAGSNWVSTTASHFMFGDATTTTPPKPVRVTGYLDTVGIRSDGTLWISSEAKPFAWTGANMMQYGTETNWRQVVRLQDVCFLLLKTDGTLWQWGTNHPAWNQHQWRTNWPSVRNDQPRQIGANADWREIGSAWPEACARKADGSTWSVNLRSTNGCPAFERQTNWDQINPQTLSKCSDQQMAFVGPDGTLRLTLPPPPGLQPWPTDTGFVQIGRETNWVSVALSWQRMVALKNDGSLWQWDLSAAKSTREVAQNLPARLGIHHDWVALSSDWAGAVTLAADGSLWYWSDRSIEAATWLKLPKQPEFLGSVFVAKTDD